LEISHPTEEGLPIVGSPLKIPTSPVQMRYPPPLLGQHTEEILKTYLGYDDDILQSLSNEGVI
jgi:crotonobetainyl-CoA:carnitine CoA-transferase CaiB-like acyl-CoA transferase